VPTMENAVSGNVFLGPPRLSLMTSKLYISTCSTAKCTSIPPASQMGCLTIEFPCAAEVVAFIIKVSPKPVQEATKPVQEATKTRARGHQNPCKSAHLKQGQFVDHLCKQSYADLS
jgi:hypothetical protein